MAQEKIKERKKKRQRSKRGWKSGGVREGGEGGKVRRGGGRRKHPYNFSNEINYDNYIVIIYVDNLKQRRREIR